MPNPFEEYKGPWPGCFKCKQPIGDDDFVEFTWRRKTWTISYNVCDTCLAPIKDFLEVGAEDEEHDPLHGRQIAV